MLLPLLAACTNNNDPNPENEDYQTQNNDAFTENDKFETIETIRDAWPPVNAERVELSAWPENPVQTRYSRVNPVMGFPFIAESVSMLQWVLFSVEGDYGDSAE